MKHNRNTYRAWERKREQKRKRNELIGGIIIVLVFVGAMLAVGLLDTTPAFSELSR